VVKDLQRFLNIQLNLNLVIDGILGPKTLTAIKIWQQANGLAVDGLVGPKTKEKMYAIIIQ
jgi:peptidoglycan hydrolase-like protein with peptidoglycan-binding domain